MATITSPRSESPAVGVPRIITSPLSPSPSGPNGNGTGNGTPISSSSMRPSFDVPRTSTSSPAPSLQQSSTSTSTSTAHRRNRAALRDYYNLKGGGRDQHHENLNISRTASIASNASDSTITSTTVPIETSSTSTTTLTAQLDDPAFDAEKYVSELLKTAGLRDILKIESTLVSEIRNLDGERKALVYDNYSKLIKAVGTIAEMQKGMHKRDNSGVVTATTILQKGDQDQDVGLDGVKKLAEKLDRLLTVVRDLVPAAAEGTEQKTKQKEMIEARKKTRQKQTVKWALDAPERLQALLDQGRRDDAGKEYESVIGLLEHWKGVAGVDELRARCDKVMREAEKDTAANKDDEAAQQKQEDDNADNTAG
ncbi:hypothetical protein KCU88_g1151, partial [Aureobasidium melanogenum]